MDYIMKIIQTLEDSNILLKGVTRTVKNETKEQKGGFFSMLLGNLLTRKGFVRAREGTIRAVYGSSVLKKSSNSITSFNKF